MCDSNEINQLNLCPEKCSLCINCLDFIKGLKPITFNHNTIEINY
jgi:hypothetical protein